MCMCALRSGALSRDLCPYRAETEVSTMERSPWHAGKGSSLLLAKWAGFGLLREAAKDRVPSVS